MTESSVFMTARHQNHDSDGTGSGGCRMEYWNSIGAPQSRQRLTCVGFPWLARFSTTHPEFSMLRNTTQTSITLEWSPLELATPKLYSLDARKNRQRLASIPNPLQNTSTKTLNIQSTCVANCFPSNLACVKTHTTTTTSGIRVCFWQ